MREKHNTHSCGHTSLQKLFFSFTKPGIGSKCISGLHWSILSAEKRLQSSSVVFLKYLKSVGVLEHSLPLFPWVIYGELVSGCRKRPAWITFNVFQCLYLFSAHPVALYNPALRGVEYDSRSNRPSPIRNYAHDYPHEVQFLINRVSNKFWI